MVFVQLILGASIIAAVVFYFYRRNRKLKDMETDERMRDFYQ